MPDQATALRRLAQGASNLRDSAIGVRNDTPPWGLPSPSATLALGAPHRATAAKSPRPPVGSRASVIAVTSGKGGVGKSNVAVNLAVRFAAAGKRVLLVDADLGLANADVLCNVEVPFNLSHVVARRKTLREVVVRVPLGGAGGERGAGFDLVGGASGLARMADLDEGGRKLLTDGLAELEANTDVVLIDTGAGISANVLGFCRSADNILVVTTPEPTAITDAYAMIKSIAPSQPGPTAERKISLLVNQAKSREEARAVYERVAKVARQFLGVNVLDAGHVVADEAVGAAVRRRTPVVVHDPRCPASACLMQLAMRLEPGVVPERARGFFARWLSRGGARGRGVSTVGLGSDRRRD